MKKYKNNSKLLIAAFGVLYAAISATAAPLAKVQSARSESYRPILKTKDTELSKILDTYEVAPAERIFEWTITDGSVNDFSETFSVAFPTACKEASSLNGTVVCEYIRSKSPSPRPAAVVLHGVTDNGFGFQRRVGYDLAKNGIDSLLLKLPYHNNKNHAQLQQIITILSDPTVLVSAFRQGVMDVRRGARFLSEQEGVDKNRIYIVGHSLGSIVGAITVGVDGYFPKAVFTVGGADLAELIETHSRTFPPLAILFQRHGLTGDILKNILVPIEPLTFASRAEKTRILMLNADKDYIVPVGGSQKLAAKFPNAKIVWNNETHESFDAGYSKYLPQVTQFLLDEGQNLSSR